MKIVDFGTYHYFLTGNKPYSIMRVVLDDRCITWGRNLEVKDHATLMIESEKIVNSLCRFLKDRYEYKANSFGVEEEKIDPLSPDIGILERMHFILTAEIKVTLTSKQTSQKFLDDLREFNKREGIKIMYHYKRNCFILA